jgi:hypothetical protein
MVYVRSYERWPLSEEPAMGVAARVRGESPINGRGHQDFWAHFPADRTSDNYPVGRGLKARRRSFEFASQSRGRALAPGNGG